jgi:hypothetical protein
MLSFFKELPEELAGQIYMRLTATKLEEIGVTDNEVWNLQRDPESSIWTILCKYYPVSRSLYEKLRADNAQLPFRAITLLFQIEQQYPSGQAVKFRDLLLYMQDERIDERRNIRMERVYVESDSIYHRYFSPPSYYPVLEETDASLRKRSDGKQAEEKERKESDQKLSQEVFITACANDHEHIIYLLTFDPNINLALYDWTFVTGLSHLAKNGNIEMLEYLLRKKGGFLSGAAVMNAANILWVAAKYNHLNIVRMLLKKFDGLRTHVLYNIQWDDTMIDSLREALDNNYFPYSFTNTDFLKFRPYQFVDIIRRGQWEVFSLLEDYFTPEEWEEWKTLDKVEQVIRNAVKTKDWRFVEALLKRPFTFYGMTLWSWFISEAIKQTDTTMFNKIINYMKTQKRFTQDYIDAIIQMAKEKPRS